MHRLVRWIIAVFFGILLVLGGIYLHAVWRQHRDTKRAESLRQASFRVRTITPDDHDFRDLERLVDLIGDRRFVLLTEATHAGGATFDAHCRLASFLHQRMGFEVLVLESDFLEMHRINLQLPASEFRTLSAGYDDLHPTRAQQALFDYVQKTRITGVSPIQVMGIHPNYTNRDKIAERCAQFFAAANIVPLDSSEWKEFQAILERHASDAREGRQRSKPPDAEIAKMAELAGTLKGTIESNREVLTRISGTDEVTVMESMLSSLPAFLQTLTMDEPHKLQRDRRQLESRDEAMAQFILDAAENRFPNSKFIVTGAPYHLVRQREALGVSSMADFLHEKLEGQTYTIVFEPFSGSSGAGKLNSPSLPAEPGTLPELLHRSGDAFRYLDLLNLPANHWLRRQRLGAHLSFREKEGVVWLERCDGVFFLEKERPLSVGLR